MSHDSRFGPRAQTAAERAVILKQMEAVCPGLFTKASAATLQLYGRYVQGELSWGEVRALRGLQEQPVQPLKRPASTS